MEGKGQAWPGSTRAYSCSSERWRRRREPKAHRRRASSGRHTAPSRWTGSTIFYREAGPQDAPTVLLLHGFPTSSHMFRNLIPALADRFHVVAPDYPGFGNSSMPPHGRVRLHLRPPRERDGAVHRAAGARRATASTCRTTARRSASGWRSSIPSACRPWSSRTATPTRRASREFWKPIKAYWREPSEANRAALRKSLELEATKWQYTNGVRHPEVDQPRQLAARPVPARPARQQGDPAAALLQLRVEPAALPAVAGVLPPPPAADADRVGQERRDLPGRGRRPVPSRPEGRRVPPARHRPLRAGRGRRRDRAADAAVPGEPASVLERHLARAQPERAQEPPELRASTGGGCGGRASARAGRGGGRGPPTA